MNLVPLSELQVTNQCVVVCDLRTWSGPESSAWRLLSGSQDEVGKQLAVSLGEANIQRLDDFGGVCESFLCIEDKYVEQPPRVKPGSGVFSFTPKKRLFAEGLEMARVSAAAGYDLMILTLQKHDKFGKVWVLCGALRHLASTPLTYYDDTNTVVDELKKSPEAHRIIAVHVRAPGFESYIAHHADRVVGQAEYRHEALA